MSCKAEIIVAQYDDAVYIPVQAVLRVGGKPTAFVIKDGTIEEQKVEVGLDDNRMIRILTGLEEGEVVLMTPPLKAATMEPGSRTAEIGSPDANDVTSTIRERVNQKLEQANGTRPDTSQQAPGGLIEPEAREPRGQRAGDRGLEEPSSEQAEQMRQRFEGMSPEERQKEIEKMRQRFESMSPEEREKMRQKFQGTGRQGRDQRQAGGQRPQEPERNQ
jgi:hypothetical protein